MLQSPLKRETSQTPPKLEAQKLDLYYGNFHALKHIDLKIPQHAITAMIGPSGCGKSTLLRVFNRMNDLIPSARIEGKVLLSGQNIHDQGLPLTALRKRVGMVFQRPNPFPLSIAANVAYGPNIHGLVTGSTLEEIVEKSLRSTGLWDELKDRLGDSALSLSPEQRQRLCISRLLANDPEVLLMDEPCSTLDPIATAKVEELLLDLKSRFTIVIVTHNMQQAARISDFTGYMFLGELIEYNATGKMFTNPADQRTQDYITGRFG